MGVAEAEAGVVGLLDATASEELIARVAGAVRGLEPSTLVEVERAVAEVLDLEERTVRDVLGRDGELVPVHRYPACRAQDAEESWDHRPPSAVMRALRDGLMDGLVGADGIAVEGLGPVAEAARAGKRFLFIGNHESVFDLAVLPHALRAGGLSGLSDRLTFFVNPKIFNTPFFNFFVCKAIGLIKMPQSPRIAANESVMAPDEIQLRAAHGFGVARARLVAGDSLAIYPEGLRSEGELHRFARAYQELLRPAALSDLGFAGGDVLLVPWAHRGVRGLESPLTAPPEVQLTFGAPVDPARFFDVLGDRPLGVAGHLAGFLVARLLPERQRGLYGARPESYLDHPHYRMRIREHTLVDIQAARQLAQNL